MKRRLHFGVECGQRWWRLSSWRRPIFRTFPQGFAVGPLMWWVRYIHCGDEDCSDDHGKELG